MAFKPILAVFLQTERIPRSGRRNPVAVVSIRQPVMDFLGNGGVSAYYDEHRRHRMLLLLLGMLFPFDEALVPPLRQQVDGRGRIVHHDLGRDVCAEPSSSAFA